MKSGGGRVASRASFMTRQATSSLNLRAFLPYRLSILTNKVSRAFSLLYSARFELSIPEWRVMAVLGQDSGLSADEVCGRTEMDKVTVSRAVSRMLKRGLLEREFSAADRRRSELRLSRSGQTVYARIIPMAHEYETRLVEVLDAQERQMLDQLLKKLDSRAARLLED